VPFPLFENPEDAEEATEIPAPAVAGSSTRGLILHKLIEELLTGELQGGVLEIERRSIALPGQLGIKPVDDPKTGIAPTEIAGTVGRTLNLPEIAPLRSRLVPEHSVFGHGTTAEGELLVSGIADAVVLDGQGGIEAVIDWKSDVNPSPKAVDHYRKADQRVSPKYRSKAGAARSNDARQNHRDKLITSAFATDVCPEHLFSRDWNLVFEISRRASTARAFDPIGGSSAELGHRGASN
jgi:hypothetical protein